jgi:hypothetical protein
MFTVLAVYLRVKVPLNLRQEKYVALAPHAARQKMFAKRPQ